MRTVESFWVISIPSGIGTSRRYESTARDKSDIVAIRGADMKCSYPVDTLKSGGCSIELIAGQGQNAKEYVDIKLGKEAELTFLRESGSILIQLRDNCGWDLFDVTHSEGKNATGTKRILQRDQRGADYDLLNGSRRSSIFSGRVWRTVAERATAESCVWDDTNRINENEESSGWINPFVVQMKLAASDCPTYGASPANDHSNDVSICLARQWAGKRLLCVEPVFPPAADLQWLFYKAWWGRVKDKPPAQRTCLERLVFGGAENDTIDETGLLPPWYPFMALDHLDGTWRIEGFGTGSINISWRNDSTTANAKWYFDYWLSKRSDIARQDMSSEHSTRRALRAELYGDRVTKPESPQDSLTGFIDGNPLLCSEAKDLLTSFVESSSGLDELLNELQLEPLFCDRYSSTRITERLASVILPLSSILVDLPQLEICDGPLDETTQSWLEQQNAVNDRLAFDMIQSRGGGKIQVLNDLAFASTLRIEAQVPAEPILSLLSKRNSWTGQWHRLLQEAPANIRIQCVEDAFQLDVSHLDEDYLDTQPLPKLLDTGDFRWYH